MAQYKAKIPIVEAIQYDGNNLAELQAFAPGYIQEVTTPPPGVYFNPSNGSNPVRINVSWWLVNDPTDSYMMSVMNNGLFNKRYEAITL